MRVTAMWRRLGNQRGFTLAELLVVSTMVVIVMAGIFVLQQGGVQAYLLGSNRVETQQDARVALDLMTRELRSAKSITTVTSSTDLTFVDQSGQTIQYALSGATLNRTVNATTTPLIGGVQTLTITAYSVYDVFSSTYTTTTTANQVKVIKISLRSPTDPRDPKMESTVLLRAKLS